jgi:hypothetical protein
MPSPKAEVIAGRKNCARNAESRWPQDDKVHAGVGRWDSGHCLAVVRCLLLRHRGRPTVGVRMEKLRRMRPMNDELRFEWRS